MALIKCRECNHDISSQASTCPYCGIKNNVRESTYLCKECQKTVNSNLKVCPYCGYQNYVNQEVSNVNADVNIKLGNDKGNCIWAIVGFFISLISLLFFNLYGIVGATGAFVSFYGYCKLGDDNVASKILAILGIIIGVISLILGIIAIIIYIKAINMIGGLGNQL